ncbi:MAG: DinB family protein [Acidobacteria bacterium]|nr:DinB family protein [Acidobacteriota bacterium]
MTTEQALFLRDFLLQRIEEAHLVTLRVLSSIPEAQSDYRPTKGSRSAREMACHIINTELILINGIVSGSFSRSVCDLPDPQMDLREMIAHYDDRFVEGIEAIRKITVKKLTSYLSFYGVFRHPAVVFLTFLHDHTVHHRGRLSDYVREMGSKVSMLRSVDGNFVSMGQPAMKYLWTERTWEQDDLARAA